MDGKPKFETPQQARSALAADKLGAAYVKADKVFVVTAHGTGEFSRKEWEASR